MTVGDLNSSRQSSEEDGTGFSSSQLGTERHNNNNNLNAIIDRSSIRIDDHSYGASRQEMSDSSMNSKFTTAVSNSKKSRHRPPSIQIQKKQINQEPKSAQMKDQQSAKLRGIDSIQQIMFQTNSNVEDSEIPSPLTHHNH